MICLYYSLFARIVINHVFSFVINYFFVCTIISLFARVVWRQSIEIFVCDEMRFIRPCLLHSSLLALVCIRLRRSRLIYRRSFVFSFVINDFFLCLLVLFDVGIEIFVCDEMRFIRPCLLHSSLLALVCIRLRRSRLIYRRSFVFSFVINDFFLCLLVLFDVGIEIFVCDGIIFIRHFWLHSSLLALVCIRIRHCKLLYRRSFNLSFVISYFFLCLLVLFDVGIEIFVCDGGQKMS